MRQLELITLFFGENPLDQTGVWWVVFYQKYLKRSLCLGHVHDTCISVCDVTGLSDIAGIAPISSLVKGQIKFQSYLQIIMLPVSQVEEMDDYFTIFLGGVSMLDNIPVRDNQMPSLLKELTKGYEY